MDKGRCEQVRESWIGGMGDTAIRIGWGRQDSERRNIEPDITAAPAPTTTMFLFWGYWGCEDVSPVKEFGWAGG